MRKIFCLVLSAFGFTFSKAQTSPYIHLDTSCVWIHDLDYYDGFDSFPFTCNGEVTTYVEKDTIMINKKWFKLITYPSSDAISNFSTMNWKCYGIAKEFVSYVHEDTINNIVYDASFGGDSLLIQYNLVQGDTIKSYPGNRIIDSITVEIFNGVARACKWSYVTILGQSTRIIEGIGPETNFPIQYFGEWAKPAYYLKCFKKNGITLYPNNPIDSCIKKPIIPLNILEEHSDVGVQFYHNQLSIKGEFLPISYSIFDMSGRKILEEQIREFKFARNLQSILPTGIYILHVQTKKEKLTQKISITD